jgi:hypothetical protein
LRIKHIPQRTCVVCRQTRPKRDLIRLVRTTDGKIEFDLSGRKAGRGAYLCRNRGCFEKALAGGQLGRALRVKLTPEERAQLVEISYESLCGLGKEDIDGG